jgi:hypothetical protein
MTQDIGNEKKQARELIDRLPPTQLSAALDRARESLARGEGIPHEEILREFGLSK